MKFSDVLHLAADKYLNNETEQMHPRGVGTPEVYSCNAIGYAYAELKRRDWRRSLATNPVKTWYEQNFLCPTDVKWGQGFMLFWHVEQPQQVRYAQLKFAALIAEEEGL